MSAVRNPWRENRELRALVGELNDLLAEKDERLTECKPAAVTELKRALLRTHEGREAALRRVAALEKQLVATQRQLDAAMGYDPADLLRIHAHTHPFEPTS